MNDMTPTEQALDLARIIETFFVELADNHFVGPCDCCGFPTPAPFVDMETDHLFCRSCRLNHPNGGHCHG